jgi:non-canonical purine NTP pyrophosphatase (RdgB/HAM1 family)
MALKFITGNNGKFNEIAQVLKPIKIQRVKIDLDEIQDLDPKKVITHKLEQAFKHLSGDFIIEDTCLFFFGLNNKLPGPYARSFLEALGSGGLYELARDIKNLNAELRTILVYAKSPKQTYFFESFTKGKMAKPKGRGGFGADPVFMPNGSKKTLAELKETGCTKYSQRYQVATKLKKFLLKGKRKGLA